MMTEVEPDMKGKIPFNINGHPPFELTRFAFHEAFIGKRKAESEGTDGYLVNEAEIKRRKLADEEDKKSKKHIMS